MIRAVRLNYQFTHLYDQVRDFTLLLDLWKNKGITLVGPPSSWQYMGKSLYMGAATYYLSLPFLVLGGFDPRITTYIFILVGALMVYPLYYGTKRLINSNAAYFVTIAYCLLPFYVENSRILWNSYLQFILTPLLIWTMGSFAVRRTAISLFLVGLMLGLLFQLHFQYILVLLGLLVYYFNAENIRGRSAIVLTSGIIVGVFPLILFELKSGFYNFRLAAEFLRHPIQVGRSADSLSQKYYYLLSSSLLLLLLISSVFKRMITKQVLFGAFFVLLACSTLYFIVYPRWPYPNKNWGYEDQIKTYNLISRSKLTDFTVLVPDRSFRGELSYFFKRDSKKVVFEVAPKTHYLFILANEGGKLEFGSRYTVLKKEMINSVYSLTLVRLYP